jgi:GNAT superfamily N-acetyltransferase
MSQKEVKKIEDLVEEELSSVTFIQDGRVEFDFNGPIVTSTEPVAEIESQTIRFPDTGSRDALCAFIANKVTAVKLDDPKAITLTFVTGTIRIPVPAADCGHIALFKLPEPPTVTIRTLDPLFLSLADAYWAHFLGCSPVKLRNDRTLLLSHAELGDYAGCYIIQFGGAPVVSLPANEIESYRHVVEAWPTGVVRSPSIVRAVSGERIKAVIGPAFIGYTDAKLFRPVNSVMTRLLLSTDEAAYEALRDACPAEDWDHGGTLFRPEEMAGVFRGKRLVAVASYKIWGECIAHISIVTHPAFRGRGYATIAVSELTQIALTRKLIPQFRTLESNQASMVVAARLGFFRYATSLAVRFKS